MTNLHRQYVKAQDERARYRNIPSQSQTVSESTGSSGGWQTDDDMREHIASSSNPHDVTASQVDVADSGGHYSSTDVEAVLAEIGANRGRYTEVFTHSSDWTVTHNLDTEIPNVTVWEDVGAGDGFGTQAFGTSPFGGTTGTRTEATNTPTITVDTNNQVSVNWSTQKTGAVAVIG